MRLAMAHPFLNARGGAEKVVLKLAQHFGAPVYCSEYAPAQTYPEFRNVDVRVLPRKIAHALPSLFPKRARDAVIAGEQFWNLELKKGDYDVLNAHGTPSEWARNRNWPVVWFCHNPNREAFTLYEWRQARRNALERALYRILIEAYKRYEFRTVRKIEHIFANSRTTQERIKKYLGCKSEVLHPGIDYKEFSCADYKKFFFYPSRIVPEKRFELAISAFSHFKRMRAHRKEKWKLVIAGSLNREIKHHADYARKIFGLAAHTGDVDIILNAPFSRIRSLYANCYSVLYTPVHEDFGIVPLEAMASRKPVLAWNEGGPTEVVENGRTGYLVNTVHELAVRMNSLADTPGMAERMGRAGRKRVEAHFGWPRFMKRFGEVCRKVAR